MKHLQRLTSRVLRHIYKVIQRTPRKTVLSIAVLVLVGAVGFWVGRTTAPAGASQWSNLTASDATSDLDAREARRLDAAYSDGKDRIATDQKLKRITSKQAQAVRAKLDELYAFRKDTLSKTPNESTAERNQKRLELRDWAKANDVSTYYFTRLY